LVFVKLVVIFVNCSGELREVLAQREIKLRNQHEALEIQRPPEIVRRRSRLVRQIRSTGHERFEELERRRESK
jgi:hypothetical protein